MKFAGFSLMIVVSALGLHILDALEVNGHTVSSRIFTAPSRKCEKHAPNLSFPNYKLTKIILAQDGQA